MRWAVAVAAFVACGPAPASELEGAATRLEIDHLVACDGRDVEPALVLQLPRAQSPRLTYALHSASPEAVEISHAEVQLEVDASCFSEDCSSASFVDRHSKRTVEVDRVTVAPWSAANLDLEPLPDPLDLEPGTGVVLRLRLLGTGPKGPVVSAEHLQLALLCDGCEACR